MLMPRIIAALPLLDVIETPQRRPGAHAGIF